MKRNMILALVLSMALMLAACAGETPETTTAATEAAQEVTLTAQELRDALKAELGDSYGCTVTEEEENVIGYFGLDAAQVESIVSDVNAISSVNMDQAVILKVKDGYAQQAAACLQKGFDQKAGYAQMYSMDMYRIGEARLFVEGNYAALLVLGAPSDPDSGAEAQAAFAASEGQKVDAAWEAVFGVPGKNILVIPEPGQQGGGMVPRQ